MSVKDMLFGSKEENEAEAHRMAVKNGEAPAEADAVPTPKHSAKAD